MRQWMLRITAYAEKLLNDLEKIDWTDSLKEMQRNWLGRSEGAEVKFKCISEHAVGGTFVHNEFAIGVFTTRPDTLFGATYLVLSPEQKLVDILTTSEQRAAVQAYQTEVAKKSDLERTELAKDKTGVFTGAYAINPVNGESIPIWIADYVLSSYGTGAIMAVPAHDERDWEFAKRFNLPIKQVVMPDDEWLEAHRPKILTESPEGPLSAEYYANGTAFDSPYCEDGYAIHSGILEGVPTPDAKRVITEQLEERGLGKKTINYKLRDWLFSRQRYWGEPFPIVWKRDEAGNLYHEALPESALPLLPPVLADYRPAPDGQPPLARAKDWVNLPDGSVRETNTMPQWAGSCWYYLRFLDALNSDAFVGKDAESYWMRSRRGNEAVPSKPSDPPPRVGGYEAQGVDLYVGGTEHAVLHLLYARFWHKVLFDLGYVSTPEPFFKLVNQGLILGEDGQKMSKSRGNVVNPDDILGEYGADAFRLYEMFLGPLEMVKPWNTKGVEGVYRFLGRVWRLFVDEASETEFEQAVSTVEPPKRGDALALIKLSAAIQDVDPTPAQLKALHTCIKKVTEDLDALRFNTAISALMVFNNEAMTWQVKPREVLREFLVVLQPFAPHLAEELFAKLEAASPAKPPTLAYVPWPKFDAALLVEDTVEMPVQVNGKLRDKIVVAVGASQAEIEAAALACEKVKPFTEGKTIKKIIVVPGRLVNIVVG
jgi:leucyl-tRNA synthetase